MYLADHARLTPDKPALISADTGRVVTFAQLDERALRVANLFRDRGLKRGDHVALLMENNLAFMDAVWACFRSGLYITTINRYLPPDEAAYIVNDCGAKVLVRSFAKREIAEGLGERHRPSPPLEQRCLHRFLQRLKLGTDGRLREMESLAGLCDAPLAGDRPEIEQMVVVQPAHGGPPNLVFSMTRIVSIE